MGWSAAADAIEEKLAEAWRPDDFAQAGSCGMPLFRQWQLLGQWCRLLGTPEPDAVRAYLGRRVLENPEQERALLVVPAGMPLPTDRSGRPLPTASAALENARVPAEILQALLPDDYTMQDGAVAARAHQDFLLQLAGDQDFLREFFGMITPDDFPPMAVQRLDQINSAWAGKWAAYRNLAIAFALVYDQREPSFWPHRQVLPAAVPRMKESVADRFGYYAQINDAGRFDYDLRRMSPGQLKFVVDAPIEREELQWAAKHVRAPRERFERAFGQVNYDRRRVEKGEFIWSKGSYRLGNIELWGGICTDQAYFASIAGKARGIPTIYFAGQGTDGGHAWFGYLRSNGSWDLDAGRYENQNYTVGEALDPQTWLPITDHELAYLSGKSSRAPGHDAALGDLAMAAMFSRRGDKARALAAAESALRSAPGLVAAWDAEERLLVARGDAAALREFYQRALNQFRREEDLRVRYQTRLAAMERDDGNTGAARDIESRMVRENSRVRADLSAGAGAETVSRLLGEGDYDRAGREYRALLVKLGRTGGGNFFYGVVRPYVEALRAAGKSGEAQRALRLARQVMPVETGSILDRDFKALEETKAAQ